MRKTYMMVLVAALLAGGALWGQDAGNVRAAAGNSTATAAEGATQGNTTEATGSHDGNTTAPKEISVQQQVAAAKARQAAAQARADAAAAAKEKQRAEEVARLEELAKLPKFKENMTLTVKSELVQGLPIELELTGVGPEFETVTIMPKPLMTAIESGNMVTFYAKAYPGDDGIHIAYNITCVQRDPKKGEPHMPFYGPRLAGTVVLQPGQALTDSKPTEANEEAAGKTVTLTMAQAAEEKPAQ